MDVGSNPIRCIMMNMIEKVYAIMVHPTVGIWHYPAAKDKQFVVYPKRGEGSVEGEMRYDSMEQMIDAAYALIDPLNVPLPKEVPLPPV